MKYLIHIILLVLVGMYSACSETDKVTTSKLNHDPAADTLDQEPTEKTEVGTWVQRLFREYNNSGLQRPLSKYYGKLEITDTDIIWTERAMLDDGFCEIEWTLDLVDNLDGSFYVRNTLIEGRDINQDGTACYNEYLENSQVIVLATDRDFMWLEADIRFILGPDGDTLEVIVRQDNYSVRMVFDRKGTAKSTSEMPSEPKNSDSAR